LGQFAFASPATGAATRIDSKTHTVSPAED
jgi:hypothetical protein